MDEKDTASAPEMSRLTTRTVKENQKLFIVNKDEAKKKNKTPTIKNSSANAPSLPSRKLFFFFFNIFTPTK